MKPTDQIAAEVIALDTKAAKADAEATRIREQRDELIVMLYQERGIPLRPLGRRIGKSHSQVANIVKAAK